MNPSAPLHLDADYLLLTDRDAERLDGGEAFWTRLASDPAFDDHISRGWLVGEYPSEHTWDQWEIHPDGDEVIHLMTGEIDVHLGTIDAATRVTAGETIVVPRDTWHTVTVHQPARLFVITWGRGTRHRPR